VAKTPGKLANRYAKALLSVVESEGGKSAQEVAQELTSFADVWNANPKLSDAVINPMFQRGQRLSGLLEIAKTAGLSDLLQRFLRTVFEGDRISALPEIAEAFESIADEAAGVVQVAVTLARDIADDERGAIAEKISQQIEGRLEFSWSTDPDLIGGMLIQYSGNVVDGSLRGRLERIERKLGA
jgi:F-type H+-transporting ATPase subunit delta